MDPYRRISHREVYHNKWLGVEVHEVVHPTGVAGEHVLIVAPPPSGVLVIDGDAFILAAQPRFGARRSVVELVKGGRDAGESALECAKRELREELGLLAETWELLGEIYEVPSIIGAPISVFLASNISTTHTDPEDVERIDVLRVPIEETYAMVERGEIQDAVTLAALLKYRLGRN